MKTQIYSLLLFLFVFTACNDTSESKPTENKTNYSSVIGDDFMSRYETVQLTTDLSQLNDEDKQIIPILIEAAEIMDDIFWQQSYGSKADLIGDISDPELKKFVEINYGPWDRLDGDKPFLSNTPEKSLGAQFYPSDMSKEEFDSWKNSHKSSLYTMITRDENGNLQHVYYHEYFKEEVAKASALLRQAADITSNKSLKYYLKLRAEALETDIYNPSDIAWLNLEKNNIDVVIGPIENYEDQLFGYKAAHECYILVKDKEWSERLEKYKGLLPTLQEKLPCDGKYKQDEIGSKAQLNAYDVIYYSGHCNSGGKTIAVNLPNDEGLQQNHGTRRSQLKNAMRAKFDKIMVPITNVLIDENQRENVTFDAFFANTMFHEVAHGLGIKNTINGKGKVREALKDQASALEEGKADVLGLWMITELHNMGELGENDLNDNYVTFMAGIFRSIRFGASSAHGKANMLRFNYFREKGAFSRNKATGTYNINVEKMKEAVTSLSALILQLQGDGAYDEVVELMKVKGLISPQLQSDLDRLDEAGIPEDIIFEQGLSALNL